MNLVGWVGGRRKILARHPENEDVDLTARRSPSFFVPSPNMMLSLATMLHSELPITHTWRANC
jgi:hypothetical protein